MLLLLYYYNIEKQLFNFIEISSFKTKKIVTFVNFKKLTDQQIYIPSIYFDSKIFAFICISLTINQTNRRSVL